MTDFAAFSEVFWCAVSEGDGERGPKIKGVGDLPCSKGVDAGHREHRGEGELYHCLLVVVVESSPR